MITVNEIMSTELITLKASDSIATARDIMKQEGIRHIPVLDENSFPVGIVTQRDILRVQNSVLDGDDNHPIDENSVPLETIMTRKIAYVYPTDPLRSAGIRMQKNKYGCLPVMQDSQLVGIITDTDFVGVAIDLIEQMDFNEDF